MRCNPASGCQTQQIIIIIIMIIIINVSVACLTAM